MPRLLEARYQAFLDCTYLKQKVIDSCAILDLLIRLFFLKCEFHLLL